MNGPRHQPVTAERIERALVLCAYLVNRDEDGEALAPILIRLEAELERARRSESPRDRAKRLLERYTPATLPGCAEQFR